MRRSVWGWLLPLVAMLAGAACDDKKKAAADGAPSASAEARPRLPEMAPMELVTSTKVKMTVSFQAPKDAKKENKKFVTWNEMTIQLFTPHNPVSDNEGMFRTTAEALRKGADPVDANEGDVLITHWKSLDGMSNMVCGVKGQKPILILGFEPDHQPVALAICRSIKVAD